MKKPLVILVFVISFFIGLKGFALGDTISVNGHSIKKLSVVTNPTTPTVGEATDDFEVNFTLRSKTGISKSRIKVFINLVPLSISSNEITLTQVESDDEDLEIYDVKIKLSGITFLRTSNEITVQYLLSSISPTSIQAQASTGKGAKSSNSTGSGGSGGGVGGGGTGNGSNLNNGSSLIQAPRLITMIVENVVFDSNGDGTVINNPTVSADPQYFRLTIDHDQRLLDVVDEETFNPSTNPVIKRLKIYRIDPNNKKDKVEVTDEFVFSVEEESVVLPSSPGLPVVDKKILETVYISDGQVLKERQNLQFVIDLTNFYKNSGIVLESNLITSDQDTIKIKAEEIEIFSPTLEEPVIFDVSSGTNKKTTYTSNTLDLTGSFSSSSDLASIDSIDFFLTEKNKKTTPKLQGKNKNHKLSLKVSEAGSNTVNSDSFTVPINLSVVTSSKALQSGGFLDSSLEKNIKIPFSITAKSSDDLDVILKGTLDQSSEVIFNAPISAETLVKFTNEKNK